MANLDHKNVFLVHFLNVRGPLRLVVIFSTGIDPLKYLVTVRQKFISFHQNDDIVHFRSFRSFARLPSDLTSITHKRISKEVNVA